MTEYSTAILEGLVNYFPEFKNLVSFEDNLMIIDKPSETEAKIGGLIIQTTQDDNLWVRIYHSFSAYSVDNLEELISIIKGVLSDDILWVISFNEEAWYETTLIENMEQLEIEPGIVYNVFSWSGNLDLTFTG